MKNTCLAESSTAVRSPETDPEPVSLQRTGVSPEAHPSFTFRWNEGNSEGCALCVCACMSVCVCVHGHAG